MKARYAALLMMAAGSSLVSQASGQNASGIDYQKAKFTTRRVLSWGERPAWSPDGNRIVFTETDMGDSFAYELDLTAQKVRCLTCHLALEGRVTRINYLLGGYVLLAPRGLGRGVTPSGLSNRSNGFSQELYWLSDKPGSTLQPLGAPAWGDLAIDRIDAASARIGWGEVVEGRAMLNVGTVRVTGGKAELVDRKRIYDYARPHDPAGVTLAEAYDFTSDGKRVTFYTIDIAGNTMNGDMYAADIDTGKLTKLYDDPTHDETHLLPGDRFGLQESNRASDPAGAWRGISSHPARFRYLMTKYPGARLPTDEEIGNYMSAGRRGFYRPFDLYVVSLDGSAPPRRLTDISHRGGGAHQSSVSADGRRIVYAIDTRQVDDLRGMEGIYIGEFTAL